MQAVLALCCCFTYYFTLLLQEGRGDAGGSVIVRADVDEGALLFPSLLPLFLAAAFFSLVVRCCVVSWKRCCWASVP